jgi:hypothetical protein
VHEVRRADDSVHGASIAAMHASYAQRFVDQCYAPADSRRDSKRLDLTSEQVSESPHSFIAAGRTEV